MTEWITSWKDIAKYLGVSVRAAQKCATKGMPVYYLGGVRALPEELDAYIRCANMRKYAHPCANTKQQSYGTIGPSRGTDGREEKTEITDPKAPKEAGQ